MKYTINLFIFLLLIGLSCSSFSDVKTKEPELLKELEILKILADAKSVYESLDYLFCHKDRNGKIKYDNKELVLLKERIGLSFDKVKGVEPKFSIRYLPFQLKVTEENQKELSIVCSTLKKDLEEVRSLMEKEQGGISLNYIGFVMALTSQNPGDYYISVSLANRMHKLVDHPLKNTIEFLYLHDSTFGDADEYFDQSLWQLSKHCPNLNVIGLNSTDMTSEKLDKINLHELKNLQVLNLSNNDITELPIEIAEMEQLIVLDLRGNFIKTFPDLSKLKNLNVLRINGYAITKEVFDKLKEMLPNTEIDAGKRFK